MAQFVKSVAITARPQIQAFEVFPVGGACLAGVACRVGGGGRGVSLGPCRSRTRNGVRHVWSIALLPGNLPDPFAVARLQVDPMTVGRF